MNQIGRRSLNPLFLTTVVLWAALYAGLTTNAVLMQWPHFNELLVLRLLTCSIGAALCGWIFLTLRPIRSYPFVIQLGLAFVAAAMAAIAWSLSNWTLIDFLIPDDAESSRPVMLSDMFPTVQLLFWVFLTWTGVYFSLSYRHQLVAREIDLAKARELALDAQNRMLRYQLNPHFLFNTLNALSALVLEDKRDQAESVLLALSRFLRYSLEQDPAAKTPLRTEVAAQEEYMAIEQIRFGDKL